LKLPSSIIGKRLIRQVLTFAVLLILLFAFLIGWITYHYEIEAFEQRLAFIQESHLDGIEAALWVNDRENLEIALMSISRIPGIEYAGIQTRDKIICKVGNAPIDQEELHRVFPIIHTYNGKTYELGKLHVKGDPKYVRLQTIRAALFLAAAQASIILFVCVLILYFLYRSVIRRLLSITAYTASFSPDNLGEPLVLERRGPTPDEMDHLADTVDQMRQNLHHAFIRKNEVEQKLRRHQSDLEKRVEQRTASLKDTNQQLQEEIDQRVRAEQDREKLIQDLQEALSEVKRLGGLLPICAHCKKIRDDRGYWNQVEIYIKDHSEAEFSHSICPDCARELYSEYNLFVDSASE